MKIGYMYILSNYKRTVLYIGVTSDLTKRLYEHKKVLVDGFSKKYRLKYLLHFEEYPSIKEAIAREKQLKRWHRDWKFNLIRKHNPDLEDISDQLLDAEMNSA